MFSFLDRVAVVKQADYMPTEQVSLPHHLSLCHVIMFQPFSAVSTGFVVFAVLEMVAKVVVYVNVLLTVLCSQHTRCMHAVATQ